ncbi:MAG: GNAT family N-acetyltransferase [Woeseia sp.]
MHAMIVGTTIEIRDATPADLHDALALNEAAVPHVNSVPFEQMQDFSEHAAYFRVALANGSMAAFLVGLTPDADYGSPNFRWFCEHFRQFAYIDRIAVAEHARRLGLASALYDDFESRFAGRVPVLACEVNLRPANLASMQFHLRRGFAQVGSQQIDNGGKEVAMLIKELDH